MAKSVLPYFSADPAAITSSGWSLLTDDGWIPLPESMPDWDYNTDLRVAAHVSADDPLLRHSTGLGEATPLRWAVTMRSADLRLGQLVGAEPYSPGEVVGFDLILKGADLGQVLELRLTLTRSDSDPKVPDGLARLAGSVLWEDRTRVVLVGDLARFPVLVTDFAASGLDPDASWALEVPEDLDAPVLGSLLLLINERDSALVKEVTGGVSGDLASAMQEFVIVTLLDRAAASSEQLLSEEWEDDSIGHTLMLLSNRVEGGLAELAARRAGPQPAYQTLLVGEARRNGLGRSLP